MVKNTYCIQIIYFRISGMPGFNGTSFGKDNRFAGFITDQFTHCLGRKHIGRAMRRPAFVPVPGFAMRLAFGEVADVVLKGQRAVPRRLLDLGFEFHFPTAEAALADLLG